MPNPRLDRQDIRFEAKDVGLRRDVHALGEMLGEMLREQGGETLFKAVESARQAAIRRRQSPDHDATELERLFDELPQSLARDFIRAFSSWFQVINMAEQVHRIRRRRAYQRDTSMPQPGGLEASFLEMRSRGLGLEEIQALIGQLAFEPVFTAHPTEPTRRTLLQKQQRIARHLLARQDPTITPDEEFEGLESIRTEITSAWQTEEHPGTRMSVADELEHILFFVTDVLYEVIPVFYEILRDALVVVYGEDAGKLELPTMINFASWLGGDIASNPDISSRTIKETLARQKTLIVPRYHRECLALSQKLTQSSQRIQTDGEVTDLIDRYSRWFPGILHGVHARHRDMPYLVALRLIAARLEASFDDADRRYDSVDQFIADLEILNQSLVRNRGLHAGHFALQKLIWRTRTFGFHLITLDVSVDAALLRKTVGQALAHADWDHLSSGERTILLHQAIDEEIEPHGDLDADSRRTIRIIETIALCRRRYGKRAISTLLVRPTQGTDDLLSALLIAQWAGLVDRDLNVPLDIAAVFDKAGEQHRAPEIMATAVADSTYRAHLAYRNDRQKIVLGSANSNKESGLAFARWHNYLAQQRLFDVIDHVGARLILCHERGGAVSRGGGRTHNVVLGAPPGTVGGYLRVTEPGEMINVKYGLNSIALRNLERTVSAVARATAKGRFSWPGEPQWRTVMETIATESRRHYRELVFETPGFDDYFRRITPIDVIELMKIGSRPISTEEDASLESMHSIPWVFAWTQIRCFLPGWYGFGTGLRIAAERHGVDSLDAMIAGWPFLNGLLEDLELVLSKCDMDIVTHYNSLADDDHHHYFDRIQEEYQLTVERLLELRGADQLMERDRALQRAIRLRNPYVDPMNLLQVELLERWREGGREDERTLKALFASVNGIAHALQNTG